MPRMTSLFLQFLCHLSRGAASPARAAKGCR